MSNDDGTTVEITHKTIGPSRPSRIRVASRIKVRDLRNAIAEKGRFPVANLRMILRGKALQDEEDGEDVYVTLKDEDSLTVAVIPKRPVGVETYDDDDDDEELKFKLPPSASRWKRKLYYFLRNKYHSYGTLLFKSEDVGYYHLVVYLGSYCPSLGTRPYILTRDWLLNHLTQSW
ncbi:PREDICTED: uncharacterized protein LOC106336860 isoform X3 [Brassica oleracea var. oleracea]|uniref:uncharacterized protein LOC106336860 isoform X3 n=1 Tax=Brassica oleracea var. oleracea TaxID=109376 RepID=UPI0006A6C782|nr:PREDICTED: uncharacterized protein LOC106336860 isoform X3 [Brassica oleracea var. oleracea]